MTLTRLPITHCRACGSTALTWQTQMVNRSQVQQGRLTTRDVECVFFLGCDHCSETLANVGADAVARLMSAQVVAPLAAEARA